MGKDDLEKAAGIVLGVFGGIALLEILSRLLGYKCPRCGAEIREGQMYCFNCGYQVRR